MAELMSAICRYWTRRAPSYSDVIRKNLDNSWEQIWADELISHFPEQGAIPLRVLDIGTGREFSAIILARRGYNITAIDCSEGMLAEAVRNSGKLAGRIDFLCMDAQCLEFADNCFDVIVTRNLTWNLPQPLQAYKEWRRVLRPGGVLLNFDANWYAYLFDGAKRAEYVRDRIRVRLAGVEDHESYDEGGIMEDISRSLPLGRLSRPQWDVLALTSLGFSSVSADTSVGNRVWNAEEKLNYASTPCFMIHAIK